MFGLCMVHDYVEFVSMEIINNDMQAEFMETKYNSHIHGYGTSVFGKIVVNISKSID